MVEVATDFWTLWSFKYSSLYIKLLRAEFWRLAHD